MYDLHLLAVQYLNFFCCRSGGAFYNPLHAHNLLQPFIGLPPLPPVVFVHFTFNAWLPLHRYLLRANALPRAHLTLHLDTPTLPAGTVAVVCSPWLRCLIPLHLPTLVPFLCLDSCVFITHTIFLPHFTHAAHILRIAVPIITAFHLCVAFVPLPHAHGVPTFALLVAHTHAHTALPYQFGRLVISFRFYWTISSAYALVDPSSTPRLVHSVKPFQMTRGIL